jgi:hypothetical protein
MHAILGESGNKKNSARCRHGSSYCLPHLRVRTTRPRKLAEHQSPQRNA